MQIIVDLHVLIIFLLIAKGSFGRITWLLTNQIPALSHVTESPGLRTIFIFYLLLSVVHHYYVTIMSFPVIISYK